MTSFECSVLGDIARVESKQTSELDGFPDFKKIWIIRGFNCMDVLRCGIYDLATHTIDWSRCPAHTEWEQGRAF